MEMELEVEPVLLDGVRVMIGWFLLEHLLGVKRLLNGSYR